MLVIVSSYWLKQRHTGKNMKNCVVKSEILLGQ